MVSVLVFVLDVTGGQCGITLSVLIERPVVNLFLRLEQAFGFIHRPYHAAASHTAQVRSNARLIAEIQIFVLTLGQCQVYVVLHLADGVAVGQCQVPTPGFQFAEVHVGHVAVHTGRRWVEIRRGCCDFIRFVTPIVFEGQAEAVVPETQVCSDVIVMRLSPRQFGIGIIACRHDDARTVIPPDVITLSCRLYISEQVRVLSDQSVIAEQTCGSPELDIGEHLLFPVLKNVSLDSTHEADTEGKKPHR